MLNNANELSTTEEGTTKGVILSKETASKFVYKEIDKEGDVNAICFKSLAFPYREDDLKQMSKWRDHFVQTVNDTMGFVTEQQDMIKSYHTFFPGYNGTIPNEAKENMIDLHEKLESQVTECTARLGEIKGGLIPIFRGIDLSIVEVNFFEKINKVLWIIGKIMRFFQQSSVNFSRGFAGHTVNKN
jgi:hypothetical protein